ncbi:MAG: hypothetical protein IV100_05990 [Myxococcales bacterium]|nr:hypothetical protein [Myxococcales bacterium]
MLASLVALSLLAVAPPTLGAPDEPDPLAALDWPAGPSLPAIRDALASDARHTPWWFWGWGATFMTAGSVQLTLSVTGDERALRMPATVGTISAFLGVLGLAIGELPPTVELLDIPGIADDPLQLREASRVQARRQRAAQGWLPHVLAVSVALAGGLYLWLGEDDPLMGGINFAISLAAGEAQIWTVPNASSELWGDDL